MPILPTLPVREENANAIGYVATLPSEGLAQLEILIKLGCKPHHRVLEIGCGALVAGFPIMQYLDTGNYCGVDPNGWLIDSALQLPEVAPVVAKKLPRFSRNDDFRTSWFVTRDDGSTERQKFDFIISHSILSHASNAQLNDFLVAARSQLAEGGVLAASIRLAEGNAVGSPGSDRHGADFTEWQYPGVSWFKEADVLERARQIGLTARMAPELTQTILAGNPKAVHDWVVARRTEVMLVSAFFRLRDRAVDEDEMFSRFDELAACGLPITLFLDQRLIDRAPKHPNVRTFPLPLEEVWPFRWADGQELELPFHRDPAKDTRDFLLMQNAKAYFLELACTLDDRSTHFAWIDFGVMKIVRDATSFHKALKKLKPPARCLLAPGCWSRECADTQQRSTGSDDQAVNWRFCGGFLLCDRDTALDLAATHAAELEQRVRLTWEVNIWAAMERNKALKFDWYKADHDDSIVGGEQRICLVMIVKNERKIIGRCLHSALPFIDTWCIADTGSTDETPALIVSFFAERGVPGKIVHTTFKDFAQARNEALDAARSVEGWDYALLVDADMMLTGTLDKRALAAPAYKIVQRNGHIDYFNTRLVRRDAHAKYIGVTHEYLSVEGVEDITTLSIDDRNDGGSKGDKGERDIRLLNAGLAEEPFNERYMFYLAQTYRGMGRHHEAIQWYKRRIERGGWDEEVWYSYYGIAHSYGSLGDEAGFIKACLDAYNYRPSRGESLKLLAQRLRERNQNEAALVFAEALERIKYPGDQLFVEPAIYDFGALQELSIAGFWSKQPRLRDAGYRACADLTVHRDDSVRNEALRNFTFYARSAKEVFGAQTHDIGWRPANGWAPMNPSVFVGWEGRKMIMRTVNYTVADGQYPTIDNSGIIRTKNYLLELDGNWNVTSATLIEDATEMPRSAFPVEGFEDCRLWATMSSYYASATVRDLATNHDGRCEMSIIRFDKQWRIDDVSVVHYEHEKTQKNWMPIVAVPFGFLYLCDPTVAIEVQEDGRAVELARHTPAKCFNGFRGGSQLVPYADGWLCIVHEVAWRPERVYLHRFVRFNREFKIVEVSDPFYFERVGIEFCAGLALDIDGHTLVASFGVNDASAHLAFFDSDRIADSLRHV